MEEINTTQKASFPIRGGVNVCFLSDCEIQPEKGGTERITHTIATELTERYGCKCYSLYKYKISVCPASSAILDSMQFNEFTETEEQKIADKLKKWHIDVFIHQTAFPEQATFFAKVMHSTGGKYIYALHFSPIFHLTWLTFKNFFIYFRKNPTLRNLAKISLYPYVKYRHYQKARRLHQDICDVSDKVVLLSVHYIPEFCKLYHINNKGNICAINNALSFDTFYDFSQLYRKEKSILVVCRMDESMKRISLVLKMWKKITSQEDLSDWHLYLVGDGPDLDKYKEYAHGRNLQRVHFEGNQNPLDYYHRSSIFCMTSNCREGWGLTLTEAQQCGCIPVAFDTYAALHDIITNGENGFIIPEGDIRRYETTLTNLMCKESLRHNLAMNAIESSHRYEKPVISAKWWQMINELYATT